MHILHVLDHSIPLQSGYTFRTFAILTDQRRRGWRTSQLTGPKHAVATPLEEWVEGFHFYRTAPLNPHVNKIPFVNQFVVIRKLQRRLRRLLPALRPDVIHVHSPALNGIAALRAARHSGIPFVYEMRASWEDAAVNHGTAREGDLRYRLSRALETHVLSHAHAVTTISEGLRRDILSRGIAPARVTVVPNAVDVERFRPADPVTASELRERLGLAGKAVVGFIGSFYAYEGLALLLQAMPQIVTKVPNVHLLLVGGGPQVKRLKEMVAQRDLREHVTFTGRVPHAEVERYYALMDLMVYPRESIRLTELVTPLKPLEAMAQGKAVTASDVGGHRELIRNDVTGLLFPPGDPEALGEAVTALLRAPERRRALARNARAFVETERTWTAVAGRYQPLYQNLANTSRPHAAEFPLRE